MTNWMQLATKPVSEAGPRKYLGRVRLSRAFPVKCFRYDEAECQFIWGRVFLAARGKRHHFCTISIAFPWFFELDRILRSSE